MNRTLTCTCGVSALLLVASICFAQTQPTTQRKNRPPNSDETTVTGTVTDEQTGKAVAEFTVIPGYGSTRSYNLHHPTMQTCSDGELEIVLDRRFEARTGYHMIMLKIEAAGYAPLVVELPTDQQVVKIDVKLKPAANITGSVVTPDGKPAAGAIVFRGTKSSAVKLENDRPPIEDSRAPRTVADEGGRFSCAPADGSFRLVALHDAGYADVMSSDFAPDKPIALRPWGRIEGIVMRGDEPQADAEVVLEAELAVHRDGTPNVVRISEARADHEGRFVLERVAPGKAELFRRVRIPDGIWNGKTCVTPIVVEPGQTAKVQIGGRGRPVTGLVVFPEGMGTKVHAAMGAMLTAVAPDGSSELRYQTEIEEDGLFHIADVEPGTYRLEIPFNERPRPDEKRLRFESVTIIRKEITVPDIPGGRSAEALDLGELEAEMLKR